MKRPTHRSFPDNPFRVIRRLFPRRLHLARLERYAEEVLQQEGPPETPTHSAHKQLTDAGAHGRFQVKGGAR